MVLVVLSAHLCPFALCVDFSRFLVAVDFSELRNRPATD